MPETDDLDRLFDSLTRDLADHAGRPGPRAAMAAARRRRRTTLVAVAATAAVAVGGGVALPQLTGGDRPTWLGDGGGALPAPVPLDAAAMDEATDGWISGWDRHADTTGTSFAVPACEGPPAPEPDSLTNGTTSLGAQQDSSAARIILWTFDDEVALQEAWADHGAAMGSCPDISAVDLGLSLPVGTEVRYFAVDDLGDGSQQSGVWVARTGSALGWMTVTTAAGAAPGDVAQDVGTALVAGLRSGWTEEREETDAREHAGSRPQLPHYDERDLTAALDGWRAADRADPDLMPTSPCLAFPTGDKAGSPTGDIAGGSTSAAPSGVYVSLVGFAEPGAQAADRRASVLEDMRRCQSVRMVDRALPGGVTLVTYDRGGDAGHGAVWLASNEDRVMVVAVDGADRPVPDDVAPAAGQFLTDVLALEWPTS